MSDTRPLEGKTAFVTGGTRGIGLAIAKALMAEGANVAITGRKDVELASARSALAAIGKGGAEALNADVRDAGDVARALDTTVARFGGLDILVNNAGVGIFAKVDEMSQDDWASILDTNLTGVFNTCRGALPLMRQRGGGFIINMSSLAGSNPFAGGAAYCASKAGLNAFTEALMQEVRHDNIRVSYVQPGSVATRFSGDETAGADWKLSPDDVAEVVVDLLRHNPRSLPSRVELRPSKPRK